MGVQTPSPREGSILPCGFCLVGVTFLPAPTPAQECAVFTHSMTVTRRGLPHPLPVSLTDPGGDKSNTHQTLLFTITAIPGAGSVY